MRDPRVLLLDEATSARDSESEAPVQGALARLIRRRMTFVVAHRLSTIRSADRVAVLFGGQLVELGSHDELQGSNGLYARLHAAQAGAQKQIGNASRADDARRLQPDAAPAATARP